MLLVIGFVAATTGLAVAVVALLRTRAQLAEARAESAHYQDVVKKRVERPEVFSHEVRTPLTLIRGAAELLAEESPGPLNPLQRQFVATITENSQRAINLAQNLLTQARIDAQLFDLRLEHLDLRAHVSDIVQNARRVHATAIRLDHGGPPLMVYGDRELLAQAWWNIINNACRHAHRTVTVSVSRSEGQAVVAVSDDGGGMTDSQRADLCEPFVSDSGNQGTGLGMTISERIIDQHGGRLLVDTIPQRGTTMFVTLPLDHLKEHDE